MKDKDRKLQLIGIEQDNTGFQDKEKNQKKQKLRELLQLLEKEWQDLQK